MGLATIFMLCQFGFTIALTYKIFKSSVNEEFSGGFRWLMNAALATPFAIDVVFSSTLVVAIRASRLGLRRDDSFLELVIIYVVNTGLLHCAFNAAAWIVCMATGTASQLFFPFQIVSLRLYANSLLSALNSRDLTRTSTIFDSGAYGMNLIRRLNHRAAAETWNTPQKPDEPALITIQVTTETEGTKSDPNTKKRLK
ncbi:hypothetical protein BD309DRAFT_69864 [Dichomitus squalens]|nr:hypothetical protein BD309DRAFT_69864 [Dichomitus squalens]